MITPEVDKYYKTVKGGKQEYVGQFIRRYGGGRYDTGMTDVFLKDGQEITVTHTYPGEYSYIEVPPLKS